MTDRKKSSIPFTNLHNHDTFSIFDGLGFPDEHIDFGYANGLDGIAFTNHGNMNSFSYAYMKAKKMKEEGKTDFRVLYGIEAYVHPSIPQWKLDKEKIKEDAKAAKDVDDDVGLVVENEMETKKGIKSVLNKRSHLVMVAQNQTGLNNLNKLISESYRGDNFYRFPRMDYDLLKKHNEGIIVSSACLGGILASDYWANKDLGEKAVYSAMEKTVTTMMDIYGDRFYGELQWANYKEQHELNKYIIEMSKRHGFQLISTCDAHYPSPDMWKDREIYKMLGWMGKSKEEIKIDALPKTLEEMEYQLFPKNGDQLFASYKLFSSRLGYSYDDKLVEESIARTSDILKNRIEDYMPDTSVKFPSFVVPEGESAESALTKMAIDNLKRKNLHVDNDYVQRLKEELHTIKDRGFSKYFLTMKKLADKSKEKQICGTGRGSGAGSLVSYLLNITEVDPIKYKLQFSRFIRKNAKDYPDIDFDVSDPMTLKQMFIEEYGENTVVPISNYNTLQIRSLIKDISKLYSVPFTEVNDVTGKMMSEAIPVCKKIHGITAGVYNPSWEELKEHSSSLKAYIQKYPKVATHVENLQGQIRSISRHAGGMLFADNLNEHMPLINSGGVIQTPWTEGQTVRHLEPLGFIKFDILGLASLRMLETCIRHILKKQGVKDPTFEQIKTWYENNLHSEKLDLNDQEVYTKIFQEGNFAGTFQFTNTGAKKFCMQAKPRSIVDLAAITSIYRPGPLSANVHEKYVQAKNDPESVQYMHPVVKEVTEETYGFIVFQEQLSLLAHKLGRDISLDEGNELRKVLTKKGTGKEAEVKNKLYDKFINGCKDKGIPEVDAKNLWATMEFFSGYGFNLSHAVCYSILSYQCAWLMHYYPAQWMAAFLDKEPEDRKEAAISIAKSFNFNIKKLDINTSTMEWEVGEDEKTLIQPLASIKGLGDAAITEIMKYRPFKSVEDLLFHPDVSYSKFNKKALDSLTRSEALNNLVDKRFTGLKHFWSAAVVDRPKTKKKFDENIEKYKPEGDFSHEEKIQNIVSLSGVYPINLVMEPAILKRLDEKFIPPIGDMFEIDPDTGEQTKNPLAEVCWFIVREITEKKTKNGKVFWILNVTDTTNKANQIKCWGIDPKKDKIWLNRPYLAKLQYEEQWGFSTRSIKHTFKLLG
jgi:DNA polymerase-3 subunit alpha